MTDQATRDALVAAVRDASRTEILPRFRSLTPEQINSKTGPNDLVTEADTAMEDRLRDAIHRLLPGVAFVGEEGVAKDSDLLGALDRGEDAVILDPIDGTWNFAHGLATFGTLLAVTDSAGTAFGLLYDPIVDDWIWSVRGGGTHHSNGNQLQSALTSVQSDMAGVYSMVGAGPRDISHVASQQPHFRTITELRASIWDYRLMCSGQLDFAISRGINPWDHAAGALALTEAGGVVRMADGRDYSPKVRDGRVVAAANEMVWSTVREAFDPVIS